MNTSFSTDASFHFLDCSDTRRGQSERRRSAAMAVPRWPATRVEPSMVFADTKRDDVGSGELAALEAVRLGFFLRREFSGLERNAFSANS
jgi:hypothetical protein